MSLKVDGLSPIAYTPFVIEVRQTSRFSERLAGLRDGRARARIAERIRRLAGGNPGDTRAVGDGVGELRIDYGPGYRVYFVRRGAELVVLLCAGDKSTQQRDIARAKELAAEVFDDGD
jgi:putative addiction module killer protein